MRTVLLEVGLPAQPRGAVRGRGWGGGCDPGAARDLDPPRLLVAHVEMLWGQGLPDRGDLER